MNKNTRNSNIYFVCSNESITKGERFTVSFLPLPTECLVPLILHKWSCSIKGGSFSAHDEISNSVYSSLSTGLNSMAAVVLEDFWKPFFRTLSHKETQILIRAVVVVIGCVCVGMYCNLILLIYLPMYL